MWVPRFVSAPRALLRRTLLMLATPLIVACFTVVGPMSTTSLAAPASWNGEALVYDGDTYVPAPSSAPQPRNTVGYQWVDTEPDPDRAHLIFFKADDDIASQSSATLVIYDYVAPDDYSNPTEPETIEVANDVTAEAEGEGVASSCEGSGGLGWVICPLSYFIAEGTDKMYGLVRDFLEVPAVNNDSRSDLYELWGVIRTLANICFVIVFLAIIYSQLTSLAISNYSIKAMLPRLIIGAILVNISFWLSAVAIDISNVLGYTIYAVFDNVRVNMGLAANVDWSGLTTFILSGGAIVGSLGFIAATGGSFTGLIFLLISALASVGFGIFVAFVVLAARQALLTVLLLLAPLAFVAYVLPGTQSLFDKWRKSFTTLLMFFPLFALLFGGSAVASAAIIGSANGYLHIVLIGLAVQIVPLIITPFLIQFSTGLLGRIAGIANSQRGLVDRTKSWSRDQAAYHKARAVGQKRAINPWKLGARAFNRHQLGKDNKKAGYEANAKAMARGYYDRQGNWRARRGWENSDRFKRQSEGDLSVAEERDKTKFTELQAGVNNYQAPRLNIRDNLADLSHNPYVRKYSGGLAPTVSYRDEAIGDPATRLAQEMAISGLSSAEAAREMSQKVNATILADADLQKRATGIGSPDIMLAGLVTKEREDYAKRVSAQDQLMRHYALDAGQYQKLAMGESNIEKVKLDSSGNITSRYTFKFDDDYTREAAIEHQLAAGSAGEKRKIINESGSEVIELNADGSSTVRAGKNYEFRTTIQDAVIKNGISRAVPYINDKAYNQIIKGEWKGELSEHGNAIRQILEGRLKAENIASANDGALKVIYQLQDLRSGNSQERAMFEQYKSHALDIIRGTSSPEDYQRIRDNFDEIFDNNYLDIQKEAGTVLDDPDLRSRAAQSSRAVLENYRA